MPLRLLCSELALAGANTFLIIITAVKAQKLRLLSSDILGFEVA
jgi:hypothetical protein